MGTNKTYITRTCPTLILAATVAVSGCVSPPVPRATVPLGAVLAAPPATPTFTTNPPIRRPAPNQATTTTGPLQREVSASLAPPTGTGDRIALGRTAVGPGGEFVLRLRYHGSRSLSSLEFTMTHNPAVFEVDTVGVPPGAGDSRTEVRAPGDRRVFIRNMETGGDYGYGKEILRLWGAAKDRVGTSTDIELTEIVARDAEGQKLPVAGGNSSLVIENPSTEFRLPRVAAAPGALVTLPISFSTDSDLVTLSLAVAYDPEALELVSANDTNSDWAGMGDQRTDRPGEYGFVGIAGTSQPVRGAGVIANLSFRVKGNPGDHIPVRFSVVRATAQNAPDPAAPSEQVPLRTVDGSVDVSR